MAKRRGDKTPALSARIRRDPYGNVNKKDPVTVDRIQPYSHLIPCLVLCSLFFFFPRSFNLMVVHIKAKLDEDLSELHDKVGLPRGNGSTSESAGREVRIGEMVKVCSV